MSLTMNDRGAIFEIAGHEDNCALSNIVNPARADEHHNRREAVPWTQGLCSS